MSLLNITPENFDKAPICIATNVHTEDGLQEYIDEFEVTYLQDLLGCDLYELFKADLVAGVPQTQKYKDIFDEFCKDDDCFGIVRSEGMIKMLEKFIYFEYTRDQKVKNTNTGNVVNSNEASRESEFSEGRIYTTHNKAIDSYFAIQWFICENIDIYPEFKGIIKKKINWL